MNVINKSASLSDMDQCIKCPEDQYPNKEKNYCLPKITIILSHEDTLGAVLVSLAIIYLPFQS
jgi:vomeronasal 2 receptor